MSNFSDFFPAPGGGGGGGTPKFQEFTSEPPAELPENCEAPPLFPLFAPPAPIVTVTAEVDVKYILEKIVSPPEPPLDVTLDRPPPPTINISI